MPTEGASSIRKGWRREGAAANLAGGKGETLTQNQICRINIGAKRRGVLRTEKGEMPRSGARAQRVVRGRKTSSRQSDRPDGDGRGRRGE